MSNTPYIRISTLNDFIFCPRSIYFHDLYGKYDKKVYQDTPQIEGTMAHESIDTKTYSTAKKYIQSMHISSEKYRLSGKIDIYNQETKTLIERKNQIKKVYDGYKYQLYAQYFCMQEMGYEVLNLTIYSMKDNIKYAIPLPNAQEIIKFERLLQQYKTFQPDKPWFTQNPKKCAMCIYRELCDYYLRTQAQCSHQQTSSKNNLLS